MSRFHYRRRHSGSTKPSEQAIEHMRQRRELSRRVFGLDNDIIDRLFRLPQSEVARFFTLFEAQYGSDIADYARQAWIPWKTKQRGISGLNAERFIALAPKFFSWDDRYELVSKLYQKTRRTETHRLTAVLGFAEGAFQEIENFFTRLCQKPMKHEWPDSLKEFVHWICDEDSYTAKRLITAIETEQSLLIVQVARAEIDRIKSAVRYMDSNVSGTHEVNLPYGTISIQIRKPTLFEKITKFIS